jgi:hypothetical protein
MRRAREAGVDVIALTDHDTLAGQQEARAALPPGLTLVQGMELSCRLDGHSTHMLAYLPRGMNQELAEQARAIREDRVRRGRAMVERLRALGVPVTWDEVERLAAGGSVGRPHIARAMVAAGAIGRPQDAFTAEWIGSGGRAYVSRYALDPGRAIALINESGGAAALAHPGTATRGWRIGDDVITTLAGQGMAGIEIDHPDHDQAERARLRALAAELDLVPTGGSDDHGELTGHRLGSESAAPEAFERLMARTSSA